MNRKMKILVLENSKLSQIAASTYPLARRMVRCRSMSSVVNVGI